ncbi:MAG: flagellar basal body-associated FliL family protein [Proteobacteria bacterium]|nr:flagellar basal body-associated FliL family protein [Pseudomonadota bacterium]MBU1594772.1 flagellar basal body-associated FliL family protein [Pseudomonadota bacterium]
MPDGDEVALDTSETARASQKVDLDLDDAPFLEDEEEVKPEPVKPKETIKLAAADEEIPAPKDKKKLIIIGAAALVLVLALALAAKFLFFKGKSVPPAEKPHQAAVQDNKTEAAAPLPPEVLVRLEPFWVEQKGEGDEIRFLIARILLSTHDQTVAKELTGRLLQARNAVFYYLKNKDVQYLTDEKNTEKLKSELLLVINQYVTDGKFETLMFEEYVVK